jgi:hypothetical protein
VPPDVVARAFTNLTLRLLVRAGATRHGAVRHGSTLSVSRASAGSWIATIFRWWR